MENFEFGGLFVPVDPAGFCIPLHEWVMKYTNSPAPVTIVDIGLKYTRGYAMHHVQKLLQKLIISDDDQHQVIVNWHFSTNSIDVKAGEYLSRKLDHPFNFVEIEEVRKSMVKSKVKLKCPAMFIGTSDGIVGINHLVQLL